MTRTITYKQLAAMQPCDLQSRKALFAGKRRLTVADAFDRGATISDVLWVAGRMGLARECVQIALFTARSVQHHNTDSRVQAAIDATQAWLDCPDSATADAVDAAADAAYAAYVADTDDTARAAYAAYVAYAAARAAYATRAADAATRAAYAVSAGAAARVGSAAIEAEIIRLLSE